MLLFLCGLALGIYFASYVLWTWTCGRPSSAPPPHVTVRIEASHGADPLVILFWEYVLTFCNGGMCGVHGGGLCWLLRGHFVYRL